jgi:uncharacterized radical SAM superfamily Fe-S cluster-containing enzyme
MIMNKVYNHTLAICPHCREKTQARIVRYNDSVWLEKFCRQHGRQQVLISSDVNWYEQSRHYVKPGQEPLKRHNRKFTGCPESCGLCPQHMQHVCLPIIEINNQCQLNCPVCLKNSAEPYSLTLADFAAMIDNLLATEGKMAVINISGGEPTMHHQLEEMISLALEKGVQQVSVSSNGLELLHNKKLRDFFKASQTIVALQFDGFNPDTYLFLRGRDLSQAKLEIISLLEAEEIPFSLVATIVKGINLQEIPRLTDFFFHSKAITLMLQPLTFTGLAAQLDRSQRVTIPCLVRQLEQSFYIKKGDFHPLPCSHYTCFALSYYLIVDQGDYLSLKSFLGEENCVNICANRTLPGLDHEGFSIMRDRLYELWSAADSSSLTDKVLSRVKTILRTLDQGNLSTRQKLALGARHMKAIFIHNFMDVDTMDLGRLMKCCNPYPRKGDRLISMCAENVFSVPLKS